MGERWCVFCLKPETRDNLVRVTTLFNGATVLAHSGCAQDHELDEAESRYPEGWL